MSQLSEQVSYILKVYKACLGFSYKYYNTVQKPQDNWTLFGRSRHSLTSNVEFGKVRYRAIRHWLRPQLVAAQVFRNTSLVIRFGFCLYQLSLALYNFLKENEKGGSDITVCYGLVVEYRSFLSHLAQNVNVIQWIYCISL